MKAPRSLYKLQERFFETLQENDPQKVSELVLEKAPLTNEQRLDIYQSGYVLRMTESLQEDFERVLKIFGEEKFQEWSLSYLKENPSTFKNLAEFSEGFPKYLRGFSEKAYDLALMDWAEILCLREATPKIQNQISLQEIQSGASFQVQKNPVCQLLKKTNSPGLVFYRKGEDVLHVEATSLELQLLEFLQTPKNLTQMSVYMLEIGIPQEQGSYLMMEWIQKDILLCLADPS